MRLGNVVRRVGDVLGRMRSRWAPVARGHHGKALSGQRSAGRNARIVLSHNRASSDAMSRNDLTQAEQGG